jgi:shikimate kinase
LLNPRAQLHNLMDARRPLYEAVATIVVSTSGKRPEDVAAEIVGALP